MPVVPRAYHAPSKKVCGAVDDRDPEFDIAEYLSTAPALHDRLAPRNLRSRRAAAGIIGVGHLPDHSSDADIVCNDSEHCYGGL